MKRSDFLKAGSLMTVPVFINGLGTKLFASVLPVIPREYNDKILVLVQMDGGNDTLNTVIPLEHYSALSALRSNILIPENKILKINDKTGLHPSMSTLKNLYQEGNVNIIRAAGYPNQNRSHFRSTDIWMSGSSAEYYETTGWLGRYFALDHPDFPGDYPNSSINYPFAVSIGSTASETCQGVKANYSIAVSDPSKIGELFEGEWDQTPQSCYGTELAYVRDMVRQTNKYSDIVTDTYNKGQNLSSKYQSGNKLASDLKTVARLISGGMKTKVYVVRIGGFDTHSGQIDPVDTTKGTHAQLLQTLSDAISAFQDDLNLLGIADRVLGMTFSEFGRQIRSNGSNGTDHGTAVDMFMFGSCVKPGITGKNPDIDPNGEKGIGVSMQYDYRSVYSTVLNNWFGLDKANTENIMMGDFNFLDLLNDCSTTATEMINVTEQVFSLSPNPAANEVFLNFSANLNNADITLFNTTGKALTTLKNYQFKDGSRLKLDISDIPTGIYYVKVKTAGKLHTGKIIKN
ncbi:MAG: DUF1501 domain-containing protein [Deltaproteobacteria bacterium]